MAVVTTAVAPTASARRAARRLAPPMWPERRGMTNCPSSSTASTAGSVPLSRTWGAMARTAMPQAPTNTMASAQANTGAVKSARGGRMGEKPSPAQLSEA